MVEARLLEELVVVDEDDHVGVVGETVDMVVEGHAL